jgi:cell division transport system permease protein
VRWLARALSFAGQALRLMRASPWLSAVSVLTIAVSLALCGLFAMAFFNGHALIAKLGGELVIHVYLDEATSAERTGQIAERLRRHDGVRAVKALSAEADRERNRELLDPALLEGLDEEAIPGQPVLELQLAAGLGSRAELEQMVAWARSIEAVEAVEAVAFGADRLRALFAVVEIVERVGVVLSLVLLASAIFFVFSTVRLGVWSRREEIELLTLMGATPAFVRAPFLLEGALQGLLGALVAVVAVGLLHLELEGLVRDVYQLNHGPSLLPPGMLAWLLGGGPALGLLASALSLGRPQRARR